MKPLTIHVNDETYDYFMSKGKGQEGWALQIAADVLEREPELFPIDGRQQEVIDGKIRFLAFVMIDAETLELSYEPLQHEGPCLAESFTDLLTFDELLETRVIETVRRKS